MSRKEELNIKRHLQFLISKKSVKEDFFLHTTWSNIEKEIEIKEKKKL